jgi:glycosyltransferase involved in cell wall biosynthesis
MASGTPVITSNASAMAEVAGDAALLVDPRDVVQIARAMAQLISDDGALRRDLARRGRMRSTAFSWRRTAGEMLQIFQEVARN